MKSDIRSMQHYRCFTATHSSRKTFDNGVQCIVSIHAVAAVKANNATPLYCTSCSMPTHLVALELADALLHLLVGVDAEALVLGDAGQLYVLGVELLLHDLLESTESEGLGFLEGQAPADGVSGVDVRL
jgi:hypothetical protein